MSRQDGLMLTKNPIRGKTHKDAHFMLITYKFLETMSALTIMDVHLVCKSSFKCFWRSGNH